MTITKHLLLLLLLVGTNSFEGNKLTYNISLEKHYVGEKYGGGIVFLTYDDGQHGLIASLSDLGQLHFFPTTDGAQLNNLCKSIRDNWWFSEYKGTENTTNFINHHKSIKGNVPYAAKACVEFKAGGYQDWYLPSSYELKSLCDNLYIINTILDKDNDPNSSPLHEINPYWSSTGFGCDMTVTYYIHEGKLLLEKNARTNKWFVRAVRKF